MKTKHAITLLLIVLLYAGSVLAYEHNIGMNNKKRSATPANVKLLIHFGDNTITDSSNNPKTFTTTFSAQLASGADYKYFGNYGGYFGYSRGITDCYSTDSNDYYLGTSDFTFDFWFKPINITSVTSYIMGQYYSLRMALVSGKMYCYLQTSTGLSTTYAFTNGNWYHIAVTRSSGTVAIYINGNYQNSITIETIDNSEYAFGLGTDTLNSCSGEFCLDEIRLIVGEAKWAGTGSFTPPTEEQQ